MGQDRQKSMPALSPSSRENQLIALATLNAEEQLSNRTASSQVICHYLKMGSTKENLEKEILMKKIELLEAQTIAIKSSEKIEELYEKAIDAMKHYGGQENSNED